MDFSNGSGKEETKEVVQWSDEIEWSEIGIVRAVVETEDPSAKDVDGLMIKRLLRARDLDVEKASNMLLKYLGWRKSFVPRGSISASEIPNDIAQNKIPDRQEKFVAIGDLRGWGYTNTWLFSVYQFCRLGKLFIIHVLYVVMTAWKLVYPFIDGRTKKIVFVEKKKLTQNLLGDINKSQLLDIYGGKLSLVPVEDC